MSKIKSIQSRHRHLPPRRPWPTPRTWGRGGTLSRSSSSVPSSRPASWGTSTSSTTGSSGSQKTVARKPSAGTRWRRSTGSPAGTTSTAAIRAPCSGLPSRRRTAGTRSSPATARDPAAKGARNADPRAADYLLYQFLSRARDTISAAQLPGAAAALNRGEQLTFGDLQLSATRNPGAERLRSLVLDQGQRHHRPVAGSRSGKKASSSPCHRKAPRRSPNCPLFLTLAQALTHQAATT